MGVAPARAYHDAIVIRQTGHSARWPCGGPIGWPPQPIGRPAGNVDFRHRGQTAEGSSMTRRPQAPASYAASLAVEPVAAAVPPAATEAQQGRGRRPLEDKADPSVVYLHPAGKKSLRLYAVERGVKVHDLLLEAIEAWAAEKGLAGPWRVPSAAPPRRQRG